MAAVGHDLADLDILQFQNRAQHGAFVADFLFFHLILGPVQLNGTAQLVEIAGKTDLIPGIAKQLQDKAHNTGNRAGNRGKQENHQSDHRRDQQRRLVRMTDGIGLWQYLSKDQHQNGHADGGIDNASLTEQLDHQAGSQRGGQNIDQVVAEQDRTDQPLLALTQVIDQTGTLVAGLGELVHLGPGGSGQGSFGTGKESRQDHKQGYGTCCYPDIHWFITLDC